MKVKHFPRGRAGGFSPPCVNAGALVVLTAPASDREASDGKFASLWSQHTNLIDLGKPEGVVGAHHQRKRQTPRSRNTTVDETVCSDIQTCKHVFCWHRHPRYPLRAPEHVSK